MSYVAIRNTADGQRYFGGQGCQIETTENEESQKKDIAAVESIAKSCQPLVQAKKPLKQKVNKYKCAPCDTQLENIESVLEHILASHTAGVLPCARCPRSFAAAHEYLVHCAAHKGSPLPKSDILAELKAIRASTGSKTDDLDTMDYRTLLSTLNNALRVLELMPAGFMVGLLEKFLADCGVTTDEMANRFGIHY